MQGLVERWLSDKNFGFLRTEDGAQRFFVHHTSLLHQRGRRELHAGDRVSFSYRDSEKGLPIAFDVYVVEPAVPVPAERGYAMNEDCKLIAADALAAPTRLRSLSEIAACAGMFDSRFEHLPSAALYAYILRDQEDQHGNL
jgi:cold shock CspA family protein